jgi:hypothetical protein
MSSFIEKCLSGDAFPEEVDDYVDAWHNSNSILELNEFLGMTEEEYGYFVMDEDVLPFIIRSHRFRKTIKETISESETSELAFAARSSDSEKAKILISFLQEG